MLTMIVPVFNEELAVETAVRGLHAALSAADGEWEILVIDDGSTDGSAAILRSLPLPGLRVVTHPKNLGNGAAIKTGIGEARGDLIGTIDADGTYDPKDVLPLLKRMHLAEADMAVGARPNTLFSQPHRLAKFLLRTAAETLTRTHIPDINSGLRLFRKPLADAFLPLSPNGFSFHITLTIAALATKRRVEFLPIRYGPRVGMSKLSGGLGGVWHFCKFCGLIPLVYARSGSRAATLPL
jgi:glycosyltransferase involved in cell wall biosynthesis